MLVKGITTEVVTTSLLRGSMWSQDHHRDHAAARARGIGGVAGVQFHRPAPATFALVAIGLVSSVGRRLPVQEDLDFGMGAQVVVPGRMVGLAEVGGDQDKTVAVRDAEQREGARLAGLGADGRDRQHGQAGEEGGEGGATAGVAQQRPVETMGGESQEAGAGGGGRYPPDEAVPPRRWRLVNGHCPPPSAGWTFAPQAAGRTGSCGRGANRRRS